MVPKRLQEKNNETTIGPRIQTHENY